MIRLMASRIVSIPQSSVKVVLASVQYEDVLPNDGLRSRISEMRTNKRKLEDAPDPMLQILFDEAEHLPGTYPFLAAVTHVLEPALCAAYKDYQKATNDLADYPSVRLARQCLAEQEEHLHLLTIALNDIDPTEEARRSPNEW